MTCNEIENRLPAYREDLLPPEEQKEIAEHLESCSRCRRVALDLQMAEKLVQGLGEVEPPPFFEQRIMSRVREEAGREKGLLRRLFYPLHIKIPIQALATIVVAVLAFHVYQQGDPEMTRIVPLSVPPIEQGADRMAAEPSRTPASPPAAAPAGTSQPGELSERSPRRSVVPPIENRGPAEMAADSRAAIREESPAAAKPAAPVAAAKEKATQPAGGYAMDGARERTGKEESAKAFDTSSPEPKRREKAADAGAVSGEGRQMMSAPAPVRMAAAPHDRPAMELTIQVPDLEAGLSELESSLARVNARIVERESRNGGEFRKVEMSAQNLSQLLRLLDGIGRVSPKTDASAAPAGRVTLGITVVHRP